MQDPFSESKSTKKKIIRSVWFWILIGLVAVGTLFFIMLPVGIDYGIERYLKNQGADEVTLENVNFNPFTRGLTINGMRVKIGTQTTLKIPEATFVIEWSAVLRKRFVLERFNISDTELIIKELEDGRWQIGGINLPDQKDTSGPSTWDFSFQETIVNNSKIKFISSRLKSDLKIEHAKISKLTSWMPERNARLEFKGQLNDGKLQLQVDVSPFGKDIGAAGQIQLKGLTLNPFARLLESNLKTLEGRLDADLNFEIRQTSDSGFSHHQKGLLNLSQIRTQIGDSDLSNENLTWDGAIRIDITKSAEELKIAANGQLNGSQLDMAMQNENLQIQQESLNWKGTLQFSSTDETDEQRLTADGELISGRLLTNLFDQKLKLEQAGFTWTGRLDVGTINDSDSFTAQGDLILTGIEVRHPETNQNLIRSDSINLKEIKIEGTQKVAVSNVAFSRLKLVAPLKAEKPPAAHDALFSSQKTTIQNVQLTKRKDLSIDAVGLKDVKTLLHRNQDGQLSAIAVLNTIKSDIFSSNRKDLPSAEQPSTPNTAAKKKSTKFGFRVGQLEITGNNLLRFEDESVSPTFGIDLKLMQGRLSDLNSRRPEQPASVKLLVSDGKQARLSLEGTIQPFAGQLNLHWIGKIESFGLPLLSPYVIQNTGYSFVSGEMQADIPLKITQNELKGKIDLMLYNPSVEMVKAEDPEKEKKGEIQLNMPLDSALKLLRDEQNNVKLNIPISGDISDPKFSVAGAINKVLAQTLQSSALSYVKFMLGPYGIGVSLAEMAFKSASKIRLNPILFAPGSTELDETAIDYLQRVAPILKEHAAVQVSVCGVATERDRAALSASPSMHAGAQPAVQKGNKGDKDKTPTQKEPAASATTDVTLLELAKNRTKRIEVQLVNAHGIAAKRIIACKPEIDKSAEANPRVDLAL